MCRAIMNCDDAVSIDCVAQTPQQSTHTRNATQHNSIGVLAHSCTPPPLSQAMRNSSNYLPGAAPGALKGKYTYGWKSASPPIAAADFLFPSSSAPARPPPPSDAYAVCGRFGREKTESDAGHTSPRYLAIQDQSNQIISIERTHSQQAYVQQFVDFVVRGLGGLHQRADEVDGQTVTQHRLHEHTDRLVTVSKTPCDNSRRRSAQQQIPYLQVHPDGHRVAKLARALLLQVGLWGARAGDSAKGTTQRKAG